MRPLHRKPADATEQANSRPNDWIEKLTQIIDDSRGKPFEYGTHDCMLFAARCRKAITGVDMPAPMRGYKGKVAALRILSLNGGMEGLLRNVLGEPIHPAMAQRGDVVLAEVETPDGKQDAVGVCVGVQSAFAGDGIVFRPTLSARLAWRI